MTPFQNPADGSGEKFSNSIFIPARTQVERAIGLFKMIMRCGLKYRTLHYHPTTASRIINSCVVLHNMCRENNVEFPEENAVRQHERFNQRVFENPEDDRVNAGYTSRNILMNHLVAERGRYLRARL